MLNPADDRTARAPRPFVLAPFRALRFDPATAGDLGTVVSPPYDVLDADLVRELEAANRHNVVRLILSRRSSRPYEAVRDRLARWRAEGALRTDPEPGLYVYTYTVGAATVRGVLGAVAIRDPEERVVLPHEDVMAEPVRDRVALMRATRANLEPILLIHPGMAGLAERLDAITATEPEVGFTALDGTRHRLWTVPVEHEHPICEGLGAGQALIADGHHRYAAYRRLQGELRAADAADGASPWDYGLALVVGSGDDELRIGPIHRSVGALTLSDVHELSVQRGDRFTAMPDRESAVAHAARPEPDVAGFVVSDGRRWAVLETEATRPIDTAVLHETLFPAWRVEEGQVGYHHSLDQALHGLERHPGVLVAVRPPTLAQVMSAAARGIRMPRKSTSFGPKPAMGMVLRDLDER